MTETLPFKYFIPAVAEKLVLGSFPCFNGNDYGDFFYSGSGRNFFWPILSEISHMPAGNIEEKKTICEKHHIALSDVALQVIRRKNNCSDSNLSIVKYNIQGIHTCVAAGVKKVYFTSRFVEEHFRKIFPGVTLPTVMLLSPSPAANRHIGGLEVYKKMLKEKKVRNVYEFRLRQYRELLIN